MSYFISEELNNLKQKKSELSRINTMVLLRVLFSFLIIFFMIGLYSIHLSKSMLLHLQLPFNLYDLPLPIHFVSLFLLFISFYTIIELLPFYFETKEILAHSHKIIFAIESEEEKERELNTKIKTLNREKIFIKEKYEHELFLKDYNQMHLVK